MTEQSRIYQTYRHYKGGIYLKICDALHTETDEIMTVYVCSVRGTVYTRPKNMFEGIITTDTYRGPRFVPITGGMTKEEAKDFYSTGGQDATRQSA